jgi:hypothetical protein
MVKSADLIPLLSVRILLAISFRRKMGMSLQQTDCRCDSFSTVQIPCGVQTSVRLNRWLSRLTWLESAGVSSFVSWSSAQRDHRSSSTRCGYLARS